MENRWHFFEKKNSNKRDLPKVGREVIIIWSDGLEDGIYVVGFTNLDFNREIYPVCWKYVAPE